MLTIDPSRHLPDSLLSAPQQAFLGSLMLSGYHLPGEYRHDPYSDALIFTVWDPTDRRWSQTITLTVNGAVRWVDDLGETGWMPAENVSC